MRKAKNPVVSLLVVLLMFSAVGAQKKSTKQHPPQSKPVMWERVNIQKQNLLLGPGGTKWRPNLSRITFIKDEKEGYSEKYRIKDGSGRVWIAKIGKEAQPEVAAVRLIWALGYKSEINYLVPKLTIPTKRTFTNVRVEARPGNIERKGIWKWDDNPFVGTNELQGLKIMMALLSNWDIKDQNNAILQSGRQLHYVNSDLGATFGKPGSNNLPILWRIGRSVNNPADYSRSEFIKGIDRGRIDFAFKGKDRDLFDGITVEQGRWLADLLLQLKDKQIQDAFRAANYSPREVRTLTRAFKDRVRTLDWATRPVQAGR